MLEAVVLLENLKKGVILTQHAVSQRSQLPILLNFLLEAGKEGFFISATDLEIGIKIKIPAKIKSEGRVSVGARTFSELIASLSQEKIEITEKDGKLNLSSEKIKTSFPTTPAEEFPKLYQEKGDKRATFTKKNFEKEIARVVFAASQDIGRPALSGVYIEKEGGEDGISLVAADGFRLSLKKNFAKGAFGKKEDQKYLIPVRVIKEIQGAKQEEGDVELFASSKSNQVLFEFSDAQIVGRLIEAEYPDYKKIIPQDFETQALFDRGEALAAVRTCLVFAKEAANIIKMSVGGGKLIFRTSASSVGENEAEVDAKTTGEENEIAFNGRYLLEFLSAIDDDDVSFEMTGPLNPGVFKLPKDPDYLHIIMPIRVQE